MVKLTFGKKKDGEPPTPNEKPDLERKPSMKISFKSQTPVTEQPPSLENSTIEVKPKKPAVPKKPKNGDVAASPASTILKLGKRKTTDLPDGELPAKRPVKPTERASSISFRVPEKPVKVPTLKLNTKVQSQSSGVKLKFGSTSTTPQPVTTPLIKIRARGKVPKREPGVGYDSEDEDAEVDPVIENHFVLRMQPGDDCDYLRAAIAESSMKHKPDGSRALGPDVWMKFFDKEGRRGLVCVRGHMYAATLLDLPCIIEAMKSWDKKGWYKTTDICQILLVLGRIDREEQARNYPLPPEVDKENWQYPHGLTPPMQWVRKRRFRPRVNRRHIERVEADVEELLARDRQWEQQGEDATITLEYVDPDTGIDEEMDAEGEDEEFPFQYQDADGNGYVQEPEGMEEDDENDDELAAMLEAGLADAEGEQEGEQSSLLNAEGSVLHASPDTLAALETAVTPGSGNTMSATEDDDEDDDDDDDVASDDEDEEAKAQRQEREQALAEVAETRKEIAEWEMKKKMHTSQLLKNKANEKLEKLRADLQVKLSGLGMEDDDE
ncbi:uncharacterized protein PV09_08828 [Verruconis gallopava]|uniref:TAFII55 protein conserved region domain-containing protein n=1 Tax=Verruconis gallopava TaxID=253628 RepID=A0A0D1XBG2_9PEZI|nr:uncharacterized protein PV09_08828 [Verruconis gallopava]KIV99525.1 hypothetical protein PV09_08828 [Verruconis gallopava]